MACRSVAVRLSRIMLGLQVVMSSLTALRKVLSARSLSVGGFQLLLLWKEGSSSLALELLVFSSKGSASRVRSRLIRDT